LEGALPRKLEDIDISEISLVDKAANRKKFAIIKREKESRTMLKKLTELLKSFLGKGVEVTEDEIKKSVEPTPDRAAAIEGAMKVLGEYDEALPEDATGAVKTLAKFAVLGVPVQAEEAEITIEKVGARLSKATLAELRKIKEAVDKILEEKEDTEKIAMYKNLPEPIVKRLKDLDALESAAAETLRKAEEKEKSDLKATVKKLADEIEVLKKTKGVTKAVKEDETEDEPEDEPEKKKVGKNEVFEWTSLLSASPEA
jgi:hypothetical protein